MSQYPEHFANRTRGRAHAFPNAALVDWDPRQEKSCIPQLCEVRSHQFASALAFPALRSEFGG